MASVYLETTIPSYLTANLSRDLRIAAHQEITHEWWQKERDRFDLYISDTVVEEISLGNPEMIERRKEILKDITTLKLNRNVFDLFQEYSKRLGLPEKAKADLYHIAFAVQYKIDYLLTWNCSHIANGVVIQKLVKINNEMGLFIPLILTPEELLSD